MNKKFIKIGSNNELIEDKANLLRTNKDEIKCQSSHYTSMRYELCGNQNMR